MLAITVGNLQDTEVSHKGPETTITVLSAPLPIPVDTYLYGISCAFKQVSLEVDFYLSSK